MLAKLALRNVRRSVRDYAVYFVTLLFGVAVFYAFNSVRNQSILFDLGSSSASAFELTANFLGMFSVVIACVLGFLVVYANRFLIRRRKQEFGTYLLLGMRPGQVSAIVLMETVCVGAISLAVGLALGVGLSQGLSFFTAGLFNIPMQQYRFIFSPDAFSQTLLCFVLIFVVVALFNTLSIRRYKLIDLLGARNRNERFRVRNPWISLAGFVVAVAVLAWAYVTLIHNGLVYFDGEFWKATALMLVGTFLFFWSVAGFVIAVVERTRGVYFRGLAMFTTRQIASKVNTAFLSLSVVCVMLFFSLTVFSTGAGLVQLFTGNVEEGTQYDATLAANLYLALDNVSEDKLAEMQAEDAQAAADYVAAQEARAAEVRAEAEKWDWSIERRLAEAVPDWDGFVKDAVQVDMYQPKRDTTTYGELMDRFGVALGSKEQNEGLRPQNVGMVGVSQFNAARALAGREPIEVGEGQFAVNNAFEMTEDLSRSMAQRGTEIVVDGQTLVATGEYVEQMLSTTTFSNDAATIIVPDAVIDGLRAAGEAPYASYLDVDYKVDRAEGDQLLYAALAQTLPPDQQQAGYGWQYRSAPWPVTVVTTANEVIEQSGGMRMMITYLALYIGFVFLITTAALLAIQQLSETSDSLPRYRLLAEIGCDRRMIFRSLATQVVVYFLAPLALAVCHSVCAVGVLGESMFEQLGISVTDPVLMTVAFTAVVYGSYLLVTYFASRGTVRASLGKRLLG